MNDIDTTTGNVCVTPDTIPDQTPAYSGTDTSVPPPMDAEDVYINATVEQGQFDSLIEGSAYSNALKQMGVPYPSMTADERLALYDLIPKVDLTTHTRKLIRIGEIRRYFRDLTPAYARNNIPEIFANARELGALAQEVISIYTMDGFHPSFGVSRLKQEAFRGNNAVIVVVDYSVRGINRADESKTAGNWFFPLKMEWIQENITHNPDAYRTLNRLPGVMWMPQRTTDVFIGSNGSEGARFKQIVFGAFSHFEEDMREKFRQAIKEGQIPANIDLDSIPFKATGYYTTIDLRGLDTSSYRAVSQAITEKLKGPISTAAFLKSAHKEESQLSMFDLGGVTLFGADALPEPGTSLHDSLQYYIKYERGFVNFRNYVPLPNEGRLGPAEQEYYAKLIEPDMGGIVGAITRRPSQRGGGYLQRLFTYVDMLQHNPALAKDPGIIRKLQKEANELTSRLLQIGEDARRDPYFKPMINPMTVWDRQPNDFFREQVAMQRKMTGLSPFAMADEGDNFGQFNIQHPPIGMPHDAYIQHIQLLRFIAAQRMGLPPPVAAREGDQGRSAIFAPDLETAERYARYWQRLTRELHADKPIQMPDGMITRLTESIALHPSMPDTSTLEGEAEYRRLLPRLALYAEHAKNANGPQKEGLGWMPEDFALDLVKMSQLDTEDIKALGKESIPFEDLKLEPMITTIEQSGKYDGLEVFMPASIPGIGVWDGEGYILQPDFNEPLPPPEPMITPATPPVPTALPMSGVIGGAAFEAAMISTPAMPQIPMFTRPATAVNSTGNPLYMFFFDSAEYVALTIGLGQLINPIEFMNDKYVKPLEEIGRYMRYENCRSNPSKECTREFGPIWI